MTLLLTGTVLGRPVRFVLGRDRVVVGSAEPCALRLADPTVSRRHAQLDVADDAVDVTDLESSNGTFCDGVRVRRCTARPGSRLGFGSVQLLLEQVAEDDLEAALRLDPAPEPTAHPASRDPAAIPATTLDVRPLDSLLLDHLPGLLETTAAAPGAATAAARAGGTLFEVLPIGWLEVSRRGDVLFVAGDRPPAGAPAPATRTLGDLEARAVWTAPAADRALAGALDLLLALVEIGRSRAPGAAAPAGSRAARPEPPALPDPPSVEARVRQVYRQAARVAPGDVSVLVRGESGTGKELLARYLHRASGRPDERFVALNCAALPRDLLEAELFGVEKGAATGVEARPGRFELAHEGTLFLDEIADMSPATQARVLRVLQEGCCHRIGGAHPRPARPRIVSATNRPLHALMADGGFRSDLYHRISGWEVELPPLRARRGDIPNLAVHFLEAEAERLGVRPAGISRRALRALESYSWPGNVRQLEQEIARAALFLDDGDLLDTRLLSAEIVAAESTEPGTADGQGLKDRLARFERTQIRDALDTAGGDVSAAAERLEIHRSTLYRRMKALGLTEG
jgi:transcriptional regulator with AAA-type ATPase domain